MLSIQVLGPKTPYTDKLEQYTNTAIRMLNPHCGCTIMRVEDDAEIKRYVDKVPALVINGQVVSEGAIPAPQLIVTWASDALQTMLTETAQPAFAQQDALAPAAR